MNKIQSFFCMFCNRPFYVCQADKGHKLNCPFCNSSDVSKGLPDGFNPVEYQSKVVQKQNSEQTFLEVFEN